jgi:hypothetical protein
MLKCNVFFHLIVNPKHMPCQMKTKALSSILLSTTLLAATHLSCTKNSNNSYLASSLVGKWKISYDSSCNVGPAVGGTVCNVFNSTVSDSSDAYYSFTSAGKIYIKEGNTIDTATYLVSSPDTLTVSNSYPQSPVIFYVANLINPDSLTLTSIGFNPMPIGIQLLSHVGLSRE